MTDQVIQFRGTIYENGYGLIAQKVMRDKDLTPTAKAIYAYLCSFAGVGKDGERTAFPGVALMKKELGITSNSTYYKHRNLLIKKGYISIEKQRKEGQKFERNLYFIEAVPVEKEEEREEKEPLSKNRTTEPLSNFRTAENPTTENRTTNSNRFLSVIGFKEEEDNIENALMNEIGKYLNEKDYEIELIIEVLKELKKIDLKNISMRDVIDQFESMMNNIEPIYDFKKYFVNGLKRRASNNKAKKRYSFEKAEANRKKAKEREEARKLYFNWLED